VRRIWPQRTPTSSRVIAVGWAFLKYTRLLSRKQPGNASSEKVEVYVTYKAVPPRSEDREALAELRRSMGMTQREAALLLEVALNTWARWERGELGVHPERARQLRRLRVLVQQYGEGPMWGLGVDGLRDVLNGATVPEALVARGLDKHGAPTRASTQGVCHD
jgi:DNA-binding transcriptional regulator YiaG